jgi:parvulin-like peptidyl-prolyl isomerase
MGRFPLDRLPPELRDDVAKMSPKQVSGVKRIKDSFYLVQLQQKTEPHQYSYEEKAQYVRNDVLYSRYRDEWKKTYDRLRKEFDVREHEPALKRFGNTAPASTGGI